MIKKGEPVFIISLDFELGWGFISHPEHKALRLLRNDPKCGRGAVDQLLSLFQRYNIPATWAAVGHLMLDESGRKEFISRELPQFRDGWIDWDFYSQICNTPLYSAPDVIGRILSSSVAHEIGLHSFFHIPFSQCSKEVAKLEVELGVNLACKHGIAPRSFVFPGNQVGHLEALKERGIKIYRGNIPRPCKGTSFLLARKATGAMVKLKPPLVLPLQRDGIWEIPGSMSFDDPLLRFTLLSRAKGGLERAIRDNKVFHIWMHPWSLLLHQSLAQDLEKLLAFVAEKRDRGDLQVLTTKGVVSRFEEKILEQEGRL